MDMMQVSAPDVDQNWDLHLPPLPLRTQGCPEGASSPPSTALLPSAQSNPKLVLDMNHSTLGSCLCVQLIICAFLLHRAATQHCSERTRHQGCAAECTAPCLSFPNGRAETGERHMLGELMGAERVGMHREGFGMLQGRGCRGRRGGRLPTALAPHDASGESHKDAVLQGKEKGESQGPRWDLSCCVEVARNDLPAGSCACWKVRDYLGT